MARAELTIKLSEVETIKKAIDELMAARDAATARAERAEAAIQRMAELIDSYPPGSTFAQSGAQALFRRVLNGDTDGE